MIPFGEIAIRQMIFDTCNAQIHKVFGPTLVVHLQFRSTYISKSHFLFVIHVINSKTALVDVVI